MHRCDVRKAFRRLGCAKVGCVSTCRDNPDKPSHTPHTYYVDIKFLVCWRCLTLPQPHDCSTISAVKLSYRDRNGTGRTLDAKTTNTNPFNNNHPYRACLCQTLYNKHKHDNHSSFCGKHMLLAQSILLFSSPTHNRCFLCRCISTSHLQHVTMLTALAYQPHHP